MKRTSWVALAALVLLIGFVVYSSLQSGDVRCEVCIDFRGRRPDVRALLKQHGILGGVRRSA